MIIPTMNGVSVDTNNLNDLASELLERVDSLYKFAETHKISLYIQTAESVNGSVTHRGGVGGAQYTETHEDWIRLVGVIDTYLSKNGLRIVKQDEFERLYPETKS